ncbi:hypothetical protein GOP47_0008470 [Adiantum capillus-veneris]|uniref:Large ribosomal subunit protein bL25 beta domain-containing protein n=1 Tax=Adiantum capillus-veneris TaxID=13818 RepID=A0A9D4ZKR2_ADICA|nr:hypothetical protein GOP47_0008470 [Adiantum capillus-veneris]
MQSWLRAALKLPSWHRSFCHSTAEWRPRLQAIARRKRGSGGAVAHRARGLISAVICDGMPSQTSGAIAPSSSLLVFLKEEEVSFCFKKLGHHVFMSTVFILHVSSSLKPLVETLEERVLPRTVNFDSSGRITNLRFIRVPAGIKLKLNCPVVIVGAKGCAGILKGGLLREYYSFVPVSCTAETLPPVVEINISKLDIGDQLLISDIKLNVDIHPDLDPAAPICEIASQA